MIDILDGLHALISLAFALWALINVDALRQAGPGRSLWVGIVALGLSEMLHITGVSSGLSDAIPAGWVAVVFHAAILVGAIASINLIHGLLGLSRRSQLINAGAGVVALLLASGPLLLWPPATLPDVLPHDPVIYDRSWQVAVHWAAFLAYVAWAMILDASQCFRHGYIAGPGRLRTSMWLVGAGCSCALLYVLAHAAIEISTFTSAAHVAWDVPLDAATVPPAMGLIALGVSWQQLGDITDATSDTLTHVATRRRLQLLRPYWHRLVQEVPEVSPFTTDVLTPATSLDQLQWQQTRMVTEIYDATRRLVSYVDDETTDWQAQQLRVFHLGAKDAQAARSELTLIAGIRARRAHAQPAVAAHSGAHGSGLIPGATAEQAAQEVVRTLRRINRRRVKDAVHTVISMRKDASMVTTPLGGGSSGASESTPILLSPEQLIQAEEICRTLTMQTFDFELRTGHHLAFVRTFASPSVAGLLAHTGHMEADPHRRGRDTGLFMYELIHNGLDSAIGKRIVERLNEMHQRWRISNDDYLWVLGTFCVLGIRMIDQYGWRRLTDIERQALIDWYRELGARMGVTDIPATYDAFDTWFRQYEATHLRRTGKGDKLVAATHEIVFEPVPRRLRPAAVRAAAVIVDEPARSALGLPTPGPVTTLLVRGLLKIKAVRRRRQGTRPPWFTSHNPNSTYPNGYTIEDLGPADSRTS